MLKRNQIEWEFTDNTRLKIEMSSKKDKPGDDDISLFHNTVKGTMPLRQKKMGVDVLDKTNKQRSPRRVTETEIDELLLNDVNPDSLESYDVTTADSLEFFRPGLQTKVMKKMRRGQYPLEDELDLHGYRVEDAYNEVMAFLNNALGSDFKCVRIIHGKGRGSKTDLPILKNKINVWLRQLPQVLAFCSAQPQDGGIGAIYVLLKTTVKTGARSPG